MQFGRLSSWSPNQNKYRFPAALSCPVTNSMDTAFPCFNILQPSNRNRQSQPQRNPGNIQSQPQPNPGNPQPNPGNQLPLTNKPNQTFNPNMAYNPNIQYNPNAANTMTNSSQLRPNAASMTNKPNQTFNPNMGYNPNITYNPNAANTMSNWGK